MIDHYINRLRRVVILAALPALLLAACGGRSGPGQDSDLAATQTIEARLPTLEAQVAGYVQDAPTPDLPVTAAIATANAEAQGGLDATSQAIMTQSAEQTPQVFNTALPTTGTGGAAATPASITGAGPGYYDGADEHDTVLVDSTAIGQTVTGELLKAFDAHNWTFEGSAGQAVTIRVDAIGETDPEVMLFDPSGVLLGRDDDGGGGFNAMLTLTLPTAGTYTIRIKGWRTGQYTLSVSSP